MYFKYSFFLCVCPFYIAGYADILSFNFAFVVIPLFIPCAVDHYSNLGLLQTKVMAGRREKGKERVHPSAIVRCLYF